MNAFGAAVFLIRINRALASQKLVARSVGVISAACSVSIGSIRSDGSSPDAHRNPTAHGCTAIDATAIDASVMNADAADASMATAIGKGVSRGGRNEHDADDSGGGKRNNGSTCHDRSPLSG
jgi:hypothetical protein